MSLKLTPALASTASAFKAHSFNSSKKAPDGAFFNGANAPHRLFLCFINLIDLACIDKVNTAFASKPKANNSATTYALQRKWRTPEID